MLSLVCFILYILEDINAISVFCILYALKNNSASLVCCILYILEAINASSVFCILYALKDNSASLVCCILYILEDINASSVFCILYGLYRKLSSHLISETNSFRRVWNIQCPSLGTQWLNISKVWGGGTVLNISKV